MSFKKIGHWILMMVIILMAAICVAAGVIIILNRVSGDNTLSPEIVDNSEAPVTTPTPTQRPEQQQQVIIEQDRTLKFDNKINVAVGKESGIATITMEEYALNVDGAVELKLVKRYEETGGFVCRVDDMFRVEGYSSFVKSNIDNSTISIEEVYDVENTYDDYLDRLFEIYPNVRAHTDEWRLPFANYLYSDIPENIPDWAISESGESVIAGIGYLDFSELGYGGALMYIVYYPEHKVWGSVCYLKVNDHRFLKLKCDSDPVNMVGYITELIQNNMVVF